MQCRTWAGPPNASKMESYATMFNTWKLVTAVIKFSILDFSEDSGFTFEVC